MGEMGEMEIFFEEVWGNSSAVAVTKFQVNVPEPQYYIDPQYRHLAEGAELSQFQLTGISNRVQPKEFVKVQLAKPMPPVERSFILREEYIRIERLLEEAETERWPNGKGGRPDDGVELDYRVSGQPGSGM